jgi:hypothetical protein
MGGAIALNVSRRAAAVDGLVLLGARSALRRLWTVVSTLFTLRWKSTASVQRFCQNSKDLRRGAASANGEAGTCQRPRRACAVCAALHVLGLPLRSAHITKRNG